jgi:hypothetical protein
VRLLVYQLHYKETFKLYFFIHVVIKMKMEMDTNPTRCEVCDVSTSQYVYVKYGFDRGDLKVCSDCVRKMHDLMNGRFKDGKIK